MVNRVLLRDFEVSEADLERELMDQLGAPSEEALPHFYVGQGQEFEPNKVITGRVRDIHDNLVVVDVGYNPANPVIVGMWASTSRQSAGAVPASSAARNSLPEA